MRDSIPSPQNDKKIFKKIIDSMKKAIDKKYSQRGSSCFFSCSKQLYNNDELRILKLLFKTDGTCKYTTLAELRYFLIAANIVLPTKSADQIMLDCYSLLYSNNIIFDIIAGDALAFDKACRVNPIVNIKTKILAGSDEVEILNNITIDYNKAAQALLLLKAALQSEKQVAPYPTMDDLQEIKRLYPLAYDILMSCFSLHTETFKLSELIKFGSILNVYDALAILLNRNIIHFCNNDSGAMLIDRLWKQFLLTNLPTLHQSQQDDSSILAIDLYSQRQAAYEPATFINPTGEFRVNKP